MIPAEATTWLRQVKKELSPLPTSRRSEVVEGLRQHLRDGLDSGLSAGEVLTRLGTPQEIAASALAADGPVPYFTPRRVAQVVALALAVTASLALAFLPFGVEVTETATPGGTGTTEVEVVSLLAQEGWTALAALGIPALLAALPLVSGRGNPRWLAMTQAVLLAAFIVIAVFSVGIFYAPAFLAALTGVFLGGGPRAATA